MRSTPHGGVDMGVDVGVVVVDVVVVVVVVPPDGDGEGVGVGLGEEGQVSGETYSPLWYTVPLPTSWPWDISV